MKKYCIAGILSVGCAVITLFTFTGCSRKEVVHKESESINFSALTGFDNIIDMAIIGSGPAGLTACVYGCRAGRHVVCFEGAEPGGLLTKTTLVENWPGAKSILGADIVGNIREQAVTLGAYFVSDSIVKVDFSTYPYRLETDDGVVVHALSVIVTTGATPKLLGIPGEDTYWSGGGVTTCAICDAPLYKGKQVVVVGGGDSAVEEAIQLTPYARAITIMVRGDKMRAAARMQEHLKEYPTISVRYNVSIQEILGDGGVVTGIAVRDNVTGAVTQEPIDGVFLAIGHQPNVALLGDQVALTASGHIKLFNNMQKTSVRGVFAAGDVADAVYRQAIFASGSGCAAALDADRFLTDNGYSPAVAQEFDAFRFYPAVRGAEPVIPQLETVEQLQAALKATKGLVVLDFYTDSCPTCLKVMLPALQRLAHQYGDLITVSKVNATNSPDLAALYEVNAVPTLLLFKDSQLVEKSAQTLTYAEIAALIERNSAK